MNREEIKSARAQRKLTQAALARLVKMTSSEISRIECGYRDMSDEEASAIATALGLKREAALKATLEKKAGPAGLARKTSKEDAALTPSPSAPVVAPASQGTSKPVPSGSDLSDPANFGVLPDPALLSPGALDKAGFRARLSSEVTRANTILHTPRVPAAVWRAWRQFEQQATDLLRGGVPAVPVAVAPVAAKPVEVTVAAGKDTESSASSEKHESKSFNSLFVEAARRLLPAELLDRLNRAAETARAGDQSIGFMKHFRRIAESELDADRLKQVTEAATQRQDSPERWRTRRGRG
ncbi:MAG: helix-turn-helix transcriptional regulator [Nibricoccus sp.]